jgi:hypothetical protein
LGPRASQDFLPPAGQAAAAGGKGETGPAAKERARLHRQALNWLRADADGLRQRVAENTSEPEV